MMIPGSAATAPQQSVPPLLRAAQELETVFVTEMLSAAGFGAARSGPFGGGAGEAQFTSLLVTEQARAMVASGGIGLAETLFNALKERR